MLHSSSGKCSLLGARFPSEDGSTTKKFPPEDHKDHKEPCVFGTQMNNMFQSLLKSPWCCFSIW